MTGFLSILANGWRLVFGSSRLILVSVLVFVFPLLFMWVAQGFFATAYDNIQLSERLRIGLLHDSISALMQNNADDTLTQGVLTNIVSDNAADPVVLTKLRVYIKTAEGYRVIHDPASDTVGTIDPTAIVIDKIAFSDYLDFQFFEYVIDGDRVWQAINRVVTTHETYYVFSEHNFAKLDRIMAYRKQQSYFVLTAVFLFVIALAYWLRKQNDWEQQYHATIRRLTERDQFSNLIAHELRTPLTAIRGYASFLVESTELSSENRRFAHNIQLSAERQVALVNDFLEVARLHSGKLTIKPTRVDVSTIITQALTDLQQLATSKGLRVEYTPPTKKPMLIETDPDRLAQILTNLVSNAIKYSERGTIVVATEETRGGLTIRVKDTGMGISADDQKKLFAQFTRVGGVDNQPITGSGLGMWITKQIVELMRGTIGVESIKGVGTHIVVTLPYELRDSA